MSAGADDFVVDDDDEPHAAAANDIAARDMDTASAFDFIDFNYFPLIEAKGSYANHPLC